MKLLKKILPPEFNLFCMGDAHEGTVLFYRNGFEEFIDMVQSPMFDLPAHRNFVVDHGDGIEAITVDDKRFDLKTTDKKRGTPFLQADKQCERLKPIRKKILCKLQGNHEAALMKFSDLAEYMCDKLMIPYGTAAAKITYVRVHNKKEQLMFKHFCTHGRKSITSTADDPLRRRVNMELILKRHLKFKAGDCLLMTKGHTHKLLTCFPDRELYLTDDGDRIIQQYTSSEHTDEYVHPDHRYYANTGSFLKLYGDGVSGYAERFEYDPVELGFIVVLVRDMKIVDMRKIVL